MVNTIQKWSKKSSNISPERKTSYQKKDFIISTLSKKESSISLQKVNSISNL
jgi:hypothetical protein